MCLYPRLIANPKYKTNKKNGGKIPPIIDPRVTQIPIACGNCIECKRQKQRAWQIRLLEEIKHTPNGNFTTLTFSDQSIKELANTTTIKGYTLDNYIATLAMHRFLERWRKTHKVSLRHWFVTELGHEGTNNIHLHGIVWYQQQTDIFKIDSHWKYGWVHKGTPIFEKNRIINYANYVNETTIGYITKYVSKMDLEHKYYKPIILCSPGIGNQYIKRPDAQKNKFTLSKETNETYTTNTGHKIALPTYYRNKLYTDEEREILWLQKLDKETRYILGAPIDISQKPEDYLNALQHAREKNTRLGYGSDKKDYDQKAYEEQLRIQMQNTRLARANKKKQ